MSVFLREAVLEFETESYLLYHIHQDEEIRCSMKQMLKEMYQEDTYSDPMVVAELLQLFLWIERRHGENVKIVKKNDRTRELLKIMYDQYKTITLSGLAEQLHYTVPYCSKYLKNVFGQSPYRVKGLVPCGYLGQCPKPSESYSLSISTVFKVRLSLFFDSVFS